MKRPGKNQNTRPGKSPAQGAPLEALAAFMEVEAFGQALLQLDVSRMRTPVRGPPTVFTDRMSFSLGNGSYGLSELKLAKADLAHLKSVLDGERGQVVEVANLLTRGDLQGARKLAEKIGLTEDAFVAAGGGAWGLLLLVVVICLSLPGDSPVPTTKEKAQAFKIKSESEALMDGLKR